MRKLFCRAGGKRAPALQAHSQIAAWEMDERLALPNRRRGHGHRACSGCARLPHAALPNTRRDLSWPVETDDLDVRSSWKPRMRLEQRADKRQVVRVADHDGVRVPDRDGNHLEAGNPLVLI